MSSAHSAKTLKNALVADVAVGQGGGPPPPPPPDPTISITQAPSDLLPDPATAQIEVLTAVRLGDLSKTSAALWHVGAGVSPGVNGTDFGLAAGTFPSGTFDFPPGSALAEDQFNVAAKSPPSADKHAVFIVGPVVNARLRGRANFTFSLLKSTVITISPITDIRKDANKVYWIYTEPANFLGYEIRTTTVAGRGWANCTVLIANQKAQQILRSALPTGVVEVLVKPTLISGQQPNLAARMNLTTVTSTYPSGLPWMSGLNPAGESSPTGFKMLDAFADWRGRLVDVINIKAHRVGTWDNLLNSLTGTSKNTEYAAAFSRNVRVEQVVPLIAGVPGSNTLNACGATDRNADAVKFFIQSHTAIANYLAGRPRKKPFIIRLGHEMEEAINAYSPQNDSDQTDFSHYNLCMKRACDIYHSIVGGPPDVYIDQCHLRGGMQNVPFTKYFPGSDYVDIVGQDSYCVITDAYIKPNTCKINNQKDIDNYMDANFAAGHPRGPRACADWCRAHGVKFGIGEWGISTPKNLAGYTDGAPGNPNDVAGTFFCQTMYDFFLAYADTLIYECYFNVDAQPKGHLIVDYDIGKDQCSNYSKAPAASAAYRSRWTP